MKKAAPHCPVCLECNPDVCSMRYHKRCANHGRWNQATSRYRFREASR